MMLRVPSPPADPYEAAAWWSAKRRLGFASPNDEKVFADWLIDPVHRLAWDETEGSVEAVGELAAHPELRAMREAALAKKGAPAQSTWNRVTWGAVAACIAAGLVIVGPSETFNRSFGPPESSTATTIQRYATQVGERRTLRLPDGSLIALNTGSVIEVDYRPEQRDVRLREGQALFKVAKNKDRPFVVTAGDRRITAVGTEFDVRLGDQGTVKVLLIEGKVKVTPIKRGGLARIIPGLDAETLGPGDELSAQMTGNVQITAADVARATSWTRGQIIFRDDRIADAVAELNRYSPTHLMVTDPRVANLRVSGVFSADKNENFVAAITAFYPIEAKRETGGVTVLAWRDRDS